MEIIGFLIWLACGVGCYFLAQQKNRNAIGWGIGGLIGGIIALIILAILSPKEP